MANYIATTEQFTATADAIRAKTGGSASLEWDASTGFADDIAGISGGGELVLDSISVLTPPSKTAYKVGDSFSAAGMVVTASYTIGEDTMNNIIVNNSDLSFSPSTMAANTTSVTISYTVDGVTKTATQAVQVFNVGSSLNNTSWAVISQVAQAGCGDAFWDVGDCKAITLNGNIGAGLSLSNLATYVFILDFNHVDNGTADNNIIFGGFKSALTNGKELCLYSTITGSKTDGTLCFNMNHWGNYNYGGWKGCDLRYDILGATETQPSNYGAAKKTTSVGYDATAVAIRTPVANTLMAALPSDFRGALRLRTHYVDNKGNKSNSNANVTSVVDAIFLLSEFEVFGLRTYANKYEKNYQTQMAYYDNGNSQVKYQHSSQSSTIYWLEASPHYNSSGNFCCAGIDGFSGGSSAANSTGLAPAFKV